MKSWWLIAECATPKCGALFMLKRYGQERPRRVDWTLEGEIRCLDCNREHVAADLYPWLEETDDPPTPQARES